MLKYKQRSTSNYKIKTKIDNNIGKKYKQRFISIFITKQRFNKKLLLLTPRFVIEYLQPSICEIQQFCIKHKQVIKLHGVFSSTR